MENLIDFLYLFIFEFLSNFILLIDDIWLMRKLNFDSLFTWTFYFIEFFQSYLFLFFLNSLFFLFIRMNLIKFQLNLLFLLSKKFFLNSFLFCFSLLLFSYICFIIRFQLLTFLALIVCNFFLLRFQISLMLHNLSFNFHVFF